MYIVMGGNGHVGSAVARTLLDRGQAVTIVTHDPGHAGDRHASGGEIVAADVNDVASLRAAFGRGRRAFLLNPPADPKTDTDAVERATVANILAALEGSGLEKVVAQSTAGAQQGERIGDLSVLWELEQGLRAQPIPAAINRAAYYMSNWDALLAPVRDTGKLPSMFAADLALPMAAPHDLGVAAADRLMAPPEDVGIRYVEGPARYSPADVARAFAQALERPVDVQVTPRDQWEQAYRQLGFSEPAAASYARMTAAVVDGGFDLPDDPIRGPTSLERYVAELVDRQPG